MYTPSTLTLCDLLVTGHEPRHSDVGGHHWALAPYVKQHQEAVHNIPIKAGKIFPPVLRDERRNGADGCTQKSGTQIIFPSRRHFIGQLPIPCFEQNSR